jgi:hypothetical protein
MTVILPPGAEVQDGSPLVLCSLPATRRGLRAYLVYPAVLCSQSRILARGDDLSAPRTHLETFPALVGLVERGVLDFPVVGVAKSG